MPDSTCTLSCRRQCLCSRQLRRFPAKRDKTRARPSSHNAHPLHFSLVSIVCEMLRCWEVELGELQLLREGHDTSGDATTDETRLDTHQECRGSWLEAGGAELPAPSSTLMSSQAATTASSPALTRTDESSENLRAVTDYCRDSCLQKILSDAHSCLNRRKHMYCSQLQANATVNALK